MERVTLRSQARKNANQDEKAQVRIFRYDPTREKRPRYDVFEFPYKEKMRILDVLIYVAENLDNSLAFRYSCSTAKCGTCGVLMNGEPKMACWEPAEKTMTIEPLPFFPIIRDLVVDRSQFDMRKKGADVFFQRKKTTDFLKDLNTDGLMRVHELRRCKECLLCTSACPISGTKRKEFAGPALLTQLAKVALDPRDVHMLECISRVLSEGLYECAMCARCETVCPQEVAIPQLVIAKARAAAVEASLVRNTLVKDTFESIHKYGNPWKKPKNLRMKWAKDLEVETFTKDKDLETLYFVGCTSSYDYRCQEIAKSMVIILNKANVDFGILGNEEVCCGDPILQMGESGLFEMLMKDNIDSFGKYGIRSIIAASPHCLNTFTKEYDLGYREVKIQHHTEFIMQLIEQDKLNLSKRIDKVVTYQDPCLLGRYCGIYEAPRKILEAIPGLSLIEMKRIKEASMCCGGGGGRIWTEKVPAKERISAIRIRDALSVDPDLIITACPFCLTNLEAEIKALNGNAKVQVKDIAEIVKDAI